MDKKSKRTIIDMSMFGDKNAEANLAYLDNVYSRIREWVGSGGFSSGKPASVIVAFGEITENDLTGSAYTAGRTDITMNLFDEAMFDIAKSSSDGDQTLVAHCYNTLCELKSDDVETNLARTCLIRWLNAHGVAQEDIGSEP